MKKIKNFKIYMTFYHMPPVINRKETFVESFLKESKQIEHFSNMLQEEEEDNMNKELEYTKKLVLIAKLYRKNLLTEKEYEKVRRRLMDNYLIIGCDSR